MKEPRTSLFRWLRVRTTLVHLLTSYLASLHDDSMEIAFWYTVDPGLDSKPNSSCKGPAYMYHTKTFALQPILWVLENKIYSIPMAQYASAEHCKVGSKAANLNVNLGHVYMFKEAVLKVSCWLPALQSRALCACSLINERLESPCFAAVCSFLYCLDSSRCGCYSGIVDGLSLVCVSTLSPSPSLHHAENMLRFCTIDKMEMQLRELHNSLKYIYLLTLSVLGYQSWSCWRRRSQQYSTSYRTKPEAWENTANHWQQSSEKNGRFKGQVHKQQVEL